MRGVTDTETSMLPGIPRSAMCVQRFDDSLSSAIRITYRISLRSSSLQEPRYPLLKVIFGLFSSSSILLSDFSYSRLNRVNKVFGAGNHLLFHKAFASFVRTPFPAPKHEFQEGLANLLLIN